MKPSKFLQYLLPILLFFFYFSANSQTKHIGFFAGSDKDSLLFDGESAILPVKISSDCEAKVTYVEGPVTADRMKRVKGENACGAGDSIMVPFTNDPVQPNDVIHPDEKLKTGPGGKLELTLKDGSVIRIGENSALQFSSDDCSGKPWSKFNLLLTLGSIWSQVTSLVGSESSYEVNAPSGVTGVRGTKFLVESTVEGNDTVMTTKTYEGKVVVSSNGPIASASDYEAKAKQLGEDFQNGKISMQEYQQKIMELTKTGVEDIQKYQVTVEAGYQTIVRKGKPPTVPEPINRSGAEWFHEQNFKSSGH